MNFDSVDTLEKKLEQEKQKNDALKAELAQKKQEYREKQNQNDLFCLYNDIKKGTVEYKALDCLDNIPIPDELHDAIQECKDFDKDFTKAQQDIKKIMDLLVGPKNSQEIRKSEEETINILDEYISISNEILSKQLNT